MENAVAKILVATGVAGKDKNAGAAEILYRFSAIYIKPLFYMGNTVFRPYALRDYRWQDGIININRAYCPVYVYADNALIINQAIFRLALSPNWKIVKLVFVT